MSHHVLAQALLVAKLGAHRLPGRLLRTFLSPAGAPHATQEPGCHAPEPSPFPLHGAAFWESQGISFFVLQWSLKRPLVPRGFKPGNGERLSRTREELSRWRNKQKKARSWVTRPEQRALPAVSGMTTGRNFTPSYLVTPVKREMRSLKNPHHAQEGTSEPRRSEVSSTPSQGLPCP